MFYSHAVPAVPLLLLGFLCLEGRTVVSVPTPEKLLAGHSAVLRPCACR